MQEIVEEIGAVAGWAAVVGLALLSALYISRARDVKRLREWAGRAPEGRGVSAVSGHAAGVPPPVQPQTAAPITRPAASRAVPPRYVAVALAGLLVLGGAATYGVTQLTADDGGDDAGNAQVNNDNGLPTKPKRNGAAIKPANVTVAVLNGTTVPGLAARAARPDRRCGLQEGHDQCLLRPAARRIGRPVRALTPNRGEGGQPQTRNQAA